MKVDTGVVNIIASSVNLYFSIRITKNTVDLEIYVNYFQTENNENGFNTTFRIKKFMQLITQLEQGMTVEKVIIIQ